MPIITLPKKVKKGEELVAIPRKEYEEFLRLRKYIPTVKLTPAQKRDLAQARREYQRGEYFTLSQLGRELGRKSTRKSQ